MFVELQLLQPVIGLWLCQSILGKDKTSENEFNLSLSVLAVGSAIELGPLEA